MKSPEICLTPKILPADHALGRYDPVSDRIFFSSKSFYDFDRETQRYAILHEIGHWFRSQFVRPSSLGGWDFGFGGEEGFADIFAMWFLNRDELLRAHRDHHAALGKWVAGWESRVEKLADEIRAGLDAKAECGNSLCVVLPRRAI
jgi:hypothetical protein